MEPGAIRTSEQTARERTMNSERNDQMTNLLADIDTLRQTAARLERAGLIVDRASLSRAHRRALFALQCRVVDDGEAPEPRSSLIGFAYPNAR
jgi:hypothetical protein